MRIDAAAFQELVAHALDGLPPWVVEHMENVAILVQPWPTPEQLRAAGITGRRTLLGLYEGIPLTRRGRAYHSVAPDRIILFQGPLQASARDRDALIEQIQWTVLHEIAHHFGFDEERVRDLGC